MVNTRGQDGPTKKALKFREKLAGRGLATDALLKKLKQLSKELESLEADHTELSTLNSTRKDLINNTLLLHKDRGVKAYVAACLADILRIHAPEAPYTNREIIDIFDFILRQLSAGLLGADSAYYAQYFRVLDQLASSKSVVLICDFPEANDLIKSFFKEFFNIARRDLPRKIEMLMADILIAIVDEANTIPTEVLEKYLLPQFQGQVSGMEKPGFRLAVHVCNGAVDKLQRHVCQYFTEVIVEHTQEDEVDFEEVSALHDLIKSLHTHCSGLLVNIIPQLEEELRAQQFQLRALATRTLGEMFADKGGRDLLRKYTVTWDCWLGRRLDKDATVRLTWVEATQALLVNHFEPRRPVEDGLLEKLADPDEKVRVAVCKVYSQLDYETALHYVSVNQLQAIGGRSADRKHSVRVQSMSCLGKLYSLAYSEIESNDPGAVKQFAWIPNQILHAFLISEAKSAAEQTLAEYILPLPSSKASAGEVSESVWTERLILTMRHLDDKALKQLLAATGLKQQRPTIWERYVQACIENNGGVIDNDEESVKLRLTSTIRRISATFPDSAKTGEDLKAFADENEGRLYKLLKACLDVQVDLKTLVKSSAEFRKRLEQSSSSLVPTFTTFLNRASLRYLNQSSIPTLIKRVQSDGDTHAKRLLVYISKHCPPLYVAHTAELVKALSDDRNSALVEIVLQALAALARVNADAIPADKRTTDKISRYAVSSDRRHAKFGARLLAHMKEGQEACIDVVNTIKNNLHKADPSKVVGHISALAQLARGAPDAFEIQGADLMAFLLKNILGTPLTSDGDDDNEWVEGEDVSPELEAKVLALKVCRQRCLAYAQTDGASSIAVPVLKLLLTVLAYGGSLNGAAQDDPKVKSRLRLQAAISLLHLATVKLFAETIVKIENFLSLALVAQDSCFPVRQRFIAKLIALLGMRKLDSRFNVIVFLTAHDPEPEIPQMARSYVAVTWRNLTPQLRLEEFELIFVRVLHFLAHHPDLSTDEGEEAEEELNGGDADASSEFDGSAPVLVQKRGARKRQAMAEQYRQLIKYIQFFVDTVANADNAPLLYHLAARLKTLRDAEGEPYSERLYVASELAQEIIKTKAHAKGWSLHNYPGKVKFPRDILQPLPTPEAQRQITQMVFLPETLAAEFAAQVNVKDKGESKKKVPGERKAPVKRKAATSEKRNGHAGKRKRRRKARDSDDDESSTADEEDDDDDDEMDDDRHDAGAKSGTEMDVDEENGKEAEAAGSSPNRRISLGRGARTRARAAIKQQTKGERKRARRHDDDDDDEESDEA